MESEGVRVELEVVQVRDVDLPPGHRWMLIKRSNGGAVFVVGETYTLAEFAEGWAAGCLLAGSQLRVLWPLAV